MANEQSKKLLYFVLGKIFNVKRIILLPLLVAVKKTQNHIQFCALPFDVAFLFFATQKICIILVSVKRKVVFS